MNKFVVFAFSAAVALSLAGCDKGPKKEGQEGGQGVNVTIPGTNTQVGAALPANKPAYIEIYPGSTVIASISNQVGGPDASGITLKTSAPMAEVAEFYKKSVAKAGFDNKGEINVPGAFTISGEKGESTYSVMLASEEGGTTIQIMYK